MPDSPRLAVVGPADDAHAQLLRGLRRYARQQSRDWNFHWFGRRSIHQALPEIDALDPDGVIGPLDPTLDGHRFDGPRWPLVNVLGQTHEPGLATVGFDLEAAGRLAAVAMTDGHQPDGHRRPRWRRAGTRLRPRSPEPGGRYRRGWIGGGNCVYSAAGGSWTVRGGRALSVT